MTRDEIEAMAAELARKAANNVRIPEGVENLDIPSFAAGMKFAVKAFTETLRVTAEAIRRQGSTVSASKALDTLADNMHDFPIVGETDDKEERH